MRCIELKRGNLGCLVLPEYGGMVGGLWIDAVQVLRMDKGLLGVGNVLAGGIPLLFPFASRCRDGQIELSGRRYFMPMHGFVKDLPFTVERQQSDECVLGLDVSAYPPYAMTVTLTYRLTEQALFTELTAHNFGRIALPIALGFHPYFRVEDRRAARLKVGLDQYWDYLLNPPRRGALVGAPDLTRDWDHVFVGDGVNAQLDCPAEGYTARLSADLTFQAVTLCTTQPGAVCVEPWQGLPDALNQGCARWLGPGCRERFTYRIALTRTGSNGPQGGG